MKRKVVFVGRILKKSHEKVPYCFTVEIQSKHVPKVKIKKHVCILSQTYSHKSKFGCLKGIFGNYWKIVVTFWS